MATIILLLRRLEKKMDSHFLQLHAELVAERSSIGKDYTPDANLPQHENNIPTSRSSLSPQKFKSASGSYRSSVANHQPALLEGAPQPARHVLTLTRVSTPCCNICKSYADLDDAADIMVHSNCGGATAILQAAGDRSLVIKLNLLGVNALEDDSYNRRMSTEGSGHLGFEEALCYSGASRSCPLLQVKLFVRNSVLQPFLEPSPADTLSSCAAWKRRFTNLSLTTGGSPSVKISSSLSTILSWNCLKTGIG